MDKIDARKKALIDRKKYDNIERTKKVLEEIINSHILDNYKHIGIYYPIGKEINILGIIDEYKDKCFYLPKTLDDIEFIKYELNDKLIDGPFNTKEPVGNPINRDLIECFIIPCVAISRDNKRIGYGKGYYDRYLAGYNGYKIGICYKEYGNLDLKLDSYDICLDKKILG